MRANQTGGPVMGGMDGNGGFGGGGGMGNGGGQTVVEMMVPGNKVGLVIGKGGETIKQLQVRNPCIKSYYDEFDWIYMMNRYKERNITL